MEKKILLSGLALIYAIYGYAIVTNNNAIGDVFSPVIMLLATGSVFRGYVLEQKDRQLKMTGLFLSLAVFMWFLCDFSWEIQTLILHIDPENNLLTLYGYSITNLFLFITILFSAWNDLKKMSKIQAFLDTAMVSAYMAVLLWLFVFEQNTEKAGQLLSDPIAMASVIMDLIIYAWINVWSFSTRMLNPPPYKRILVTGGLIFVITDFIYWYVYFYTSYVPNSWIDGAYVLGFTLMAASAYARRKKKSHTPDDKKSKVMNYKLGFDILILLVPIAVFIFKRSQIQYFILLVVILLIYFVLINYAQKSSFQGKLLELEKKHVLELEKKVEERTEEIRHILNTDPVTGLYSRRYFETFLTETMNDIHTDESVAVLYIDQNKSKAIKNLYGKEVTEKLLKEVGQAFDQIAATLQGSILASYGEDVFVIMLRGRDAELEAEKMAELLVMRCNELFLVDNHAIRVTINIGISYYPQDSFDANELIRNADVAMMQARGKGFNRIQFYNEQIGMLTYGRHRIEMKLKKAVFDQEFLLYFQPQVYCEDGRLCGFETLIRWYEGGKRFIAPLDFIPVAEEIGMIVPLGYWIMEHAARQYAIWKEKTGRDIRISINVSSRQLVELDFVKRLQNTMEKYDVLPEAFEIEITESQQIDNNLDISETLSEIKKLGVSIAIDDFGTGYSSLYYIKNIPADRIKIAKELIDYIESDIYSNSIIQMIISIAKVRKIKVIAEGVETKEQWECLRDLGCDEIQGFYFAKPLPPEEIETQWLSNELS